jgi:hypothetical protein
MFETKGLPSLKTVLSSVTRVERDASAVLAIFLARFAAGIIGSDV